MRSTTSTSEQVAVFLTGAPGTGKSTVAQRLTALSGYSLFLSGHTLRRIAEEEPDSPIGREVGSRLARNESMPITLYCDVIGQVLGGRAHTGLVIDGYPRTAEQCRAIPSVLHRTGMANALVVGIELHAPPALSIERIARRGTCLCGNEISSSERCCANGTRHRRTDDTSENTVARLVDHQSTAARIAEVFAESWNHVVVDASGHVDEVVADAVRALAEFAPESVERSFQPVHERG